LCFLKRVIIVLIKNCGQITKNNQSGIAIHTISTYAGFSYMKSLMEMVLPAI